MSELQRPTWVMLIDGTTLIEASRIRQMRVTGPWPASISATLDDASTVEIGWGEAAVLAAAYTPAAEGSLLLVVDAGDGSEGLPPQLKAAPLWGVCYLGGLPIGITAGGAVTSPTIHAVKLQGSSEVMALPSGDRFDTEEAFLRWGLAQVQARAAVDARSVAAAASVRPVLH